jgi:hypothetical protein
MEIFKKVVKQLIMEILVYCLLLILVCIFILVFGFTEEEKNLMSGKVNTTTSRVLDKLNKLNFW